MKLIPNDLTSVDRAPSVWAAFEAGQRANFDGILLRGNPHIAGSNEARAWEAGHIDAQRQRDEWEDANHERARHYAGAAA
jgi:hypothetical protein